MTKALGKATILTIVLTLIFVIPVLAKQPALPAEKPEPITIAPRGLAPIASQGPDIVVDPLELSAELFQNETGMEILTIRNMGAVTRTWEISETAAWLSTPVSGTVAPQVTVVTGTVTALLPGTASVEVALDATGLAAATYVTTLTVTSDAPGESPIDVPVTLTVSARHIFLPIVLRQASGTLIFP